MARSAILLVAALGAVSTLVAAGLRLDARERRTAPCPAEDGAVIAARALERPAGRSVWSAWTTYPPVAGEPVTVLWRVADASGRAFSVTGRDRDGRPATVAYAGPVIPPLAGGTLPWRRAGREWGSRLVFPHAGCWRVEFEGGGRRGAVEVAVRRRALSGERLSR